MDSIEYRLDEQVGSGGVGLSTATILDVACPVGPPCSPFIAFSALAQVDASPIDSGEEQKSSVLGKQDRSPHTLPAASTASSVRSSGNAGPHSPHHAR